MKKFCICFALLLSLLATAVGAIVPYDTYTYSADGSVLSTAHAYVPDKILSSDTIEGLDSLLNPKDIFVDGQGFLYIADTGHNRIVVLNGENKMVRIVDSYSDNGADCTFSEPSGIFVTENGDMYVADTGNGKIVAISEKGETLRILRQPKTASWDDEYPFSPVSVAVDQYGKVYAVAMNVTLGVIVYDSSDQFETFLGAQKVTYDLMDFLWKRFMTDEQKNRMTQAVPTEYSNLDIDKSGFVYAVSTGYDPTEIDATIRANNKDGRVAPVRKLNPGGYDILQKKGYFLPAGDIVYPKSAEGEPLVSSIIDVALGPADTYTLLDARFGRLFTYSQQGELLFAFGAKSAQNGNSQNPVAVSYRGNDLIVLDSVGGRITTYVRTEYADLLIRALEMYKSFDNEGATEVWKKIIESNPNLDVAYDNVGQALLRQKKYDEAMQYFVVSDNQSLYSEAFAGKRNELIREWFIPLMIAAVLLIVAVYWLFWWIQRVNSNHGKHSKFPLLHHISYAFYVAVHPFKGFWDIKHENRGSAAAASVFYIFAFLSELFQIVCSAFIFNTSSNANGVMNIAFQTAGASLLFVVSNWCLTSLMDGEGSIKEIYTNVGYALLPFSLLNCISVPLSYAFIQGEGMYLTMLHSIGVGWTLILIFIGILVAQQYGFIKNTVTCLFSVIGMAILIFVALLCVTMYSQLIQFLEVVFFELFKR